MNSLEFIEKTIKSIEYQLEHTKKQIKYGNLSETSGNLDIDENTKILQTLQQIKTDLEEYEKLKDKATPKKPIFSGRPADIQEYCPECHSRVANIKYCWNCGQLFDRSN